MRAIDTCYQISQTLHEPGIDEGLAQPSPQDRVPALGKSPARQRRILVTGATGFIGCRVAEILSRREGCDVRALVHTPANASRLARLRVEMVMGDLSSREDAHRLVDSMDAIVHCAIAPPWASRKETREVTVGGTRHLIESAMAAGVDRFVHLSSFGIHGNEVSGVIEESTPIRPPKGDNYSEAKAASERVVLKAAGRGLPAVVLRPTNVYGPFSKTFIVRPIEYLKRGQFVLTGSKDMPSNTVHVDNLVEAIWSCLMGPTNLCGEVFLIGDEDHLTWGEFYGFFAAAIGARLPTAPAPPEAQRARWPGHSLWEGSARWGRSARQIMTSHEFKEFGRKILDTDPVGQWPRQLLQASPRLRQWVRRRLRMEGATVYRRQDSDDADIFQFDSRPAEASTEKARRVLGYRSIVSREEGLQRTLDWLHYAGGL